VKNSTHAFLISFKMTKNYRIFIVGVEHTGCILQSDGFSSS